MLKEWTFALIFVLIFMGLLSCSPAGNSRDSNSSSSVNNVVQYFIDDYPVVRDNGVTYYIDSAAGSDSADGLSQGNAWKTVAKANNASLSAGATVRFKRGGVWRERINPQSGSPTGWITYSDYGAGNLPLFLGSIEANHTSNWTETSANKWQYNGIVPDDAGNIFFNNTTTGYKVWSLADVNSTGRFYYDKSTSRATLYATANPATLYTDIEIWTGQHMVYTPKPVGSYQYAGADMLSNVIFENLNFQYGGAYVLKFNNTHHIIISNCTMTWSGGAELIGRPQVRYGNGIEFYGYAYYCKAVANTIYEMYDSGVSVQCVDGSPIACGVEFSANFISNCSYASYELWYSYEPGNISILSNISFTGNSCYDAGLGWGIQRSDEAGYQVLMSQAPGRNSGIVITNNLFRNSKRWHFALSDGFNGYQNAYIDYNRYSSSTNSKVFLKYHYGNNATVNEFDLTQLAAYTNSTGYDTHSVFAVE